MDAGTVELRIPATAAWVALVRTAATATGARQGRTVEALDDLALAVDEACALLLAHTADDGELVCRFTTYDDGALDVHLAGPTDAPPPQERSFAWLVLTSLVDDVTARTDGRHLSFLLRLAPAAHAGSAAAVRDGDG